MLINVFWLQYNLPNKKIQIIFELLRYLTNNLKPIYLAIPLTRPLEALAPSPREKSLPCSLFLLTRSTTSSVLLTSPSVNTKI